MLNLVYIYSTNTLPTYCTVTVLIDNVAALQNNDTKNNEINGFAKSQISTLHLQATCLPT